MDDISRELPLDTTGATPVSERQKGPEELQRFERGQVGEHTSQTPEFGDRLAGMGTEFLVDRISPVSTAPDGDGAMGEEPLGHSGVGDSDLGDSDLGEGAGDGGEGQTPPESAKDPETDNEPEIDIEAASELEPGSELVDTEVGDTEVGDTELVDTEVGDSELGDSEPCDADATDADATDAEATPCEGSDQDANINLAAAQAAVAAEAGTVAVEQSLDELIDSELGEDGLPIVPELKDPADIAKMVYVLMLTSREGMTIFRLAQACNTSQKLVEQGLVLLEEQLRGLGLPVELTRVGDSVRWMSTASAFPYLQRLRGVKKLERLSPAALETLAVIAYRQPVMRGEIEAIRGVKAGPMLRTLLQHKLVKVTGRADVPGRPLQYGTSQQFLERFGLASLRDLPSVKEWKNLG